jgi:hypothetical protein
MPEANEAQANDFEFITSVNTIAQDDPTRRRVRSRARRLNKRTCKPSQESNGQASKFRVMLEEPSARGCRRNGDDAENGPRELVLHQQRPPAYRITDLMVLRELPFFQVLPVDIGPDTVEILRVCLFIPRWSRYTSAYSNI